MSFLPQGLELLRVPLPPRMALESHATTAVTGQVAGRVQTRSEQHPERPSPAKLGLRRATSAAGDIPWVPSPAHHCGFLYLQAELSPSRRCPPGFAAPQGALQPPRILLAPTQAPLPPPQAAATPRPGVPSGSWGQLLNPPPGAAASADPAPETPEFTSPPQYCNAALTARTEVPPATATTPAPPGGVLPHPPVRPKLQHGAGALRAQRRLLAPTMAAAGEGGGPVPPTARLQRTCHGHRTGRGTPTTCDGARCPLPAVPVPRALRWWHRRCPRWQRRGSRPLRWVLAAPVQRGLASPRARQAAGRR